MDTLDGFSKIFEMQTRGNRKLVEILKKSCLAQEELRLKKGAVVMFLKNNPIKKYVNGTLGKVTDFSAGGLPIVKTYDGRTIEVEEESWVIDEDGKIKAELKQIPLRLAWAITIHKSQGMSLDCAEIDLSKSFVEGMGYVALSRVKKIDGLRLMGLNDIALRVNKEVFELDKKLLLFSEKAVDELNSFSESEIRKIQETFLNLVSPTKEEKQESLSTYEKTKLLINEKISLQEMADKREVTKETIVGHIEKLLESGEKIDIDYIKKSYDKNRLEKILKAFKKTGDKKLTPVKEILGDSFGFDEIRIARLFLKK
ncbi:MAG: helix-turn-helix domain-containing protein [Candidatus Pacebacteria bacterium]|nr:helix-turn-helix domain-containing protein [Candidatus Paceibacterota bacterium]